MKTCPTCKKEYEDGINFCLDDGSTLRSKRASKNAKPASRANDVIAIALIALGVLIFLCLISFDQSDPTFNTASSQKVKNWIGVVGANFAEVLLSVVGITAYLLPAILAVIAWRVSRAATLRPPVARVIGYLLLIASLSGLAAFVGWHGGLVGEAYARAARSLLSQLGAAILMLATLIASLMLVTRISISWFASHFDVARDNFGVHFREWQSKRITGRPEHSELASERAARRRSARSSRGDSIPGTVPSGSLRPSTVRDPAFETRPEPAAKTAFDPVVSGLHISPPGTPPAFSNSAGMEGEAIPPTIRMDAPSVTNGAEAAAPAPEISPEAEAAPEPAPVAPAAKAEPVEKPAREPKPGEYTLPSFDFLQEPDDQVQRDPQERENIARFLEEKTAEFNVAGEVRNAEPGPVVTTYEFKPDAGVKYSRVTGLVEDLSLALKAESIRIARIPGKAVVGIEVPNKHREVIRLRDVIESREFQDSPSLLTVALGKTIHGHNYVTDLAKMPHLLIAGATGAGKSVGVNTLVVSILYKAKPDEVKFIMVDPKRLELGVYKDIPHLASPIITDPKRAAAALKWAVAEMERRYKYLAGFGVRNIDGYNTEAARRNCLGQVDEDGNEFAKLPYIVCIIDELADLMMVAGKEVEESITRLAQMARAVGIHLILATQRPSVDVITGLIKANFPARISFRVSSKVDSRTIIDGNGAESLLGRGDMLFLPPAASQVVRVHGAFVDEHEIAKIVDHIRPAEPVVYDESITQTAEEKQAEAGGSPGMQDTLFWDAVRTVVSADRASTSLLQRNLQIGYGRAAKILDAMVAEGFIGDMEGSTRARPILAKAREALQDVEKGALGE